LTLDSLATSEIICSEHPEGEDLMGGAVSICLFDELRPSIDNFSEAGTSGSTYSFQLAPNTLSMKINSDTNKTCSPESNSFSSLEPWTKENIATSLLANVKRQY
jgi:hypothetical protein